ncbi:hypothetical protein ABC733_00085 [Mangrovibacter sp. SLW1]
MKIIATLADSFMNGSSDDLFATDWPFLTVTERRNIAEFMVYLGRDYALKGKNKPSWVDDYHNTIPGTDDYERLNYWHYHCGPTWNVNTFRSQTINLKFNPGGMHSSECIHYVRESDTSIVIVGYSRNHIPF